MIKTRSAGVVVVRPAGDSWRCLLLRCYRNWDFPKGEVEPGEEPIAAAVREVMEETGLTGLDFSWGDAYLETEPYGRGKVARYYVAQSDGGNAVLGISPTLGRPEHHEFRWVRLNDAAALLPPRLQPVLAWARRVVEGGAAANVDRE